MNDMIERVAREIDDALTRIGGWEECSGEDMVAVARAAIEAMRSPTAEMVDAAGSHWGTALESDWQTMIDAALS